MLTKIFLPAPVNYLVLSHFNTPIDNRQITCRYNSALGNGWKLQIQSIFGRMHPPVRWNWNWISTNFLLHLQMEWISRQPERFENPNTHKQIDCADSTKWQKWHKCETIFLMITQRINSMWWILPSFFSHVSSGTFGRVFQSQPKTNSSFIYIGL